ncbi:MAG: recombinase RecA [Euryarchaeota archaeon]|nr:recombinase RecA [Euryarchaeota archaeon]
MSDEKVICPKCGGEINENTLVCNSCGAKYTREEYEELKNEQSLKSWLLGGENMDEAILGSDENAEALKKWLEGDENAFFDWADEQAIGEEKVSELKVKAAEMKEGVSAGDVNVDDIIKENLRIKSLLEVETSRREELEEEVEKLKKQLEVLQQDALKELPQEEKNLKMLEMELKKKEIELEMREKRLQLESQKMGGISPEQLEDLKEMVKNSDVEHLLEKINELSKELAERDKLISELKNEIAIKEEEMRKLQEMIAFKENEIARREQDLMFREKKLEKEIKNLELAKSEMGNMDELALKRRLEDLQDEIKRKEEELRVKMKYLEAKERELKAKMEGLVEEEVAMAEEEIKAEIKERKVKTGTRRLDDLLYGGFPLASNIIVYGPPYSKKEVLIYAFMAEGLRKGIPIIWVLTDKTAQEIREDMSYVLPAYEQYEKMGLVYYIDAYTRSIGDDTTLEGVIYLDSQTDVEGIIKTVGDISKKLKGKYPYYRLGFMTLSTIMAYMEQQDLLRFLQVFTTWRKRDNAVALYLLEKGLHSENEIEMVGKSMSGMIEFKMEGHKTYLTVKGITEAQSRGWIEVEATKSMIRLGSFSLGHIR